jgi:glyoxylase-like metal-dependent hydrolase (beta-lactamase superfamily II)/predicted DCC family thiol-disulfide oxidoreductase YuxK
MDSRRLPLTAIYDAQCEICQAAVSWIRALDRRGLVECVALQDGPVQRLHPDLLTADCLAQLHVVDAAGRVSVGWQAVARIAAAIPATRPLAALDRLATTRAAADRAYRFVARNRHQLSTCRGGSCAADPAQVRLETGNRAFWTCYSLGMLLRLPLVGAITVRDQACFVRDYARTFRRRRTLLDGRLELWFLGGWPADLVPLAFGERFTAIWYKGVLIDPGSVRMRRSLTSHLHAAAQRGQTIAAVTATHGHEEHVGNLEWAAHLAGANLVLPERIAARLRPPAPIPWARAAVIGQPPGLHALVRDPGESIALADGGRLEVIPAPGHSPDHVVFWDRAERVLLVGDAFMGSYFSSPNPDVDSRAWMATLRRLLDLDVQVMVEGHGHVHSLRTDVPPVPGVVRHSDPRAMLREKLEFLTWLDARISEARAEGRTKNATVAACFPWGRSWSWERLAADEIARLSTVGEFSRHQLVRSFHRTPHDVLPTVFEARFTPRDPT